MSTAVFKNRFACFLCISPKGGFTLIEAIAVTMLVGTVFAAAVAALLPAMKLARLDRVDVTVSDELNVGLERIKTDALSASAFSLPSGEGGNRLNLTIQDFTGSVPIYTIEYRIAGAANALTRRRTDTGVTTAIIDGLSAAAYNTVTLPNCFTVTLIKNDTEGTPIRKRASVMLRCRGAV